MRRIYRPFLLAGLQTSLKDWQRMSSATQKANLAYPQISTNNNSTRCTSTNLPCGRWWGRSQLQVIDGGLLWAPGKDPGPREALRSIHGRVFDVCIRAFAMGALMATAVFLIIPEAMHRE